MTLKPPFSGAYANTRALNETAKYYLAKTGFDVYLKNVQKPYLAIFSFN